MAVALNSATYQQLAFVEAERQWGQGEKPWRARPSQVLPFSGWVRCLAMAGRGWGKTRTGASWLRRQAGLYPGVICHVIAPTYSDLRGVVFEGPAGLRAMIPPECVKSMTYSPYPEMVLWNGSIIRGFSSETPDRLRGPQATFVWGDELASWYKPDECIANIDFSTRIAYRTQDGRLIQPQKLYTTTPKPITLLDKMIKEGVRLIRGSTYDNRENLAADFFDELEKYEGTQIGRQELHGELLDISESAIIKKSWLRMYPANRQLPWLEYVMVSLDTAFSEKTYDKKTFASDPTACTTWGVFKYENKWNLLLLDAWQEWLGFPELVAKARKELKAIYGHREEAMFKPLVGSAFVQHQVKKPDILIIEDKGSGISLRQTLSAEGVDSWPYNPGNADKLQRLHVVSHLPKNGRIWIPEGRARNKKTGLVKGTGEFAAWATELLDQVCVYSGPGTTPHDDWVDSSSQAWRVFSDMFVNEGVDKRILTEKEKLQLAMTPVGPDQDEPHEYQHIEVVDDAPRDTRGGRGTYD